MPNMMQLLKQNSLNAGKQYSVDVGLQM